ncbi:Fumarylacetoacetate hydrolase domain-containing protein 2 [Trichoderma lentiforme]|uniref:Fumarylacetoacetate hydrolase domain-containing protein 2 n=1 Tax=Trichoderma lentiforme TaxID=1567552 RepID=A0A9P5C9F6_9HYPO|nr:Fumarylacetoacetate hydrolase domain-containing protein 2 [Trichoderma lentiforme]
MGLFPVQKLPKTISDENSGKGLDAEDVPLHHLLAHKAKSNSISSWILHHFHEKQAYYEESEESRKSSCSPQAHFIPTPPKTIQHDNTTHVCAALGICEDEYLQLIDLYFSDLTSVSLFHRPTFQQRINSELDPEQSTALLASMFSLSARHLCNDRDDTRKEVLNPSKFYEIASNLVHKQLRNCGDKSPPLFLLQAFIMTTYYELVSGVRGVAWRSLGAVVRIAYELRLHLVDLPLKLSSTKTDTDPVEVWMAKEERRRAWWTIWEFEVFATTIRKCPLGMDPEQHATLLPVDDKFWFNGEKKPSCFFETDPVLRWKELKNSDNESGRAWFIVINSFMRDAHALSNASVPVDSSSGEDTRSYGGNRLTSNRENGQDIERASKLAVLDNCVSCFKLSLPQNLRYRSEHLFSSPSSGQDQMYARRIDSEKQTIHAMIQLARIMILHKDCFRNDDRALSREDDTTGFSNTAPSSWPGESNSHTNSVWSRYLDAADNVNLDKLQSTLSSIRAHVVSKSSAMNQPSAAPHSPEEEFTPHVHGDTSLKNNDSSLCKDLGESEQSNATDCGQQIDMTSCEGNFSLDSGDYVCDASLDGSNLDLTLDLPIDTIFSEIWQNSQQHDLCHLFFQDSWMRCFQFPTHTSSSTMARNWTHLIRFIADEDNQIHLGQIDPSVNADVGLDTYNGKRVQARLIVGSAFDGTVTDKILTVKQLLAPLDYHDVPLVRCLGLNYHDHAIEAKMPIPEEPVLFIKPRTTICSPYPTTINFSKIGQDDSSDYEAELAFIIAKDGKDIPEEKAGEYILGYTCSNDVSVRSQQFKNSQWCFSKGFDGSAPIGPVLVSPNAIGDPGNLAIQAIYNGDRVQDSNTRELIFNVKKIISFLSQGTTLERGTVVMTGTGPGIGSLRNPKIFLRDGDDIRVYIEKIGTLINRTYYE